jgi:hypothetical protein
VFLLQTLLGPVRSVQLLSIPNSAIGIVWVFAAFTYARQLALRIPDERLAKTTRTVMWGTATVGALGLVLLAVFVFAGPMLPMTRTMAGATVFTTSAPSTPVRTATFRTTRTWGTFTTVTTSGPATKGMTPAVGILAASGCLVGLPGLIFGIWALVLLLRYRRAMLAAATLAEQTWAAPTSVTAPAPIEPTNPL